MTDIVLGPDSPIAKDALAVLHACMVRPHPTRVYVVEPDHICFVDVKGNARLAYIRYDESKIVLEAVVPGWPV